MFFFCNSCILVVMNKRQWNKKVENIRRKIQRSRNRQRRNRDVYTGRARRIALWAAQIGAVVILAFLLVAAFGIRITCSGMSMDPTVADGETVLVNRAAYLFSEPQADDVVVFSPEGAVDGAPNIKRVVGVPGDTVEISGGSLYVNGERYSDVADTERMEYAGRAGTEITPGEDEYFVLGDNRNNSEDSRYQSVGNVTADEIEGKVWLKVSLSDFGLVR